MKLLFIGNSHTFFNDMPHTVGELFRLTGMEIPDVVQLTHPGSPLTWHAGMPQTRFNLQYGHYDYAVLQDVAHPFGGRDPLMSGAAGVIGFMDRTVTTPVFYMTWASVAHPEDQQPMIDAYTEAAATYHGLLAPVGLAWSKVRYGHPEVNLYWQDGEHASPFGSYLAASAIFCAITGKRSLDPDMADAFYDEQKLDRAACAVIHAAVAEAMQEIGR